MIFHDIHHGVTCFDTSRSESGWTMDWDWNHWSCRSFLALKWDKAMRADDKARMWKRIEKMFTRSDLESWWRQQCSRESRPQPDSSGSNFVSSEEMHGFKQTVCTEVVCCKHVWTNICQHRQTPQLSSMYFDIYLFYGYKILYIYIFNHFQNGALFRTKLFASDGHGFLLSKIHFYRKAPTNHSACPPKPSQVMHPLLLQERTLN